jgi:hypothetical protein
VLLLQDTSTFCIAARCCRFNVLCYCLRLHPHRRTVICCFKLLCCCWFEVLFRCSCKVLCIQLLLLAVLMVQDACCASAGAAASLVMRRGSVPLLMQAVLLVAAMLIGTAPLLMRTCYVL